jgi:hypothetical protein
MPQANDCPPVSNPEGAPLCKACGHPLELYLDRQTNLEECYCPACGIHQREVLAAA